MNYRSQPKPQIQRVNVRMHPVPVVKKQSPQMSVIHKPVSRPTLPIAKPASNNIQKPVETVKSRPPIKQDVRQHTKVRPSIQINRSPNVVKPRNISRHSSSMSAQHQNLLQQYKESVDKLRCVGNNKILIIVACGPSILNVNIEELKDYKNIDIMCINKPDKRVWPSPYWLFCDQSQYARNQDTWEQYNGIVINASSVRARHRRQILIKSLSGRGFSRDLAKGFYIGRSSTYSAMQVALWMNYSKIYIFGVDMCAVDGKLHYYGKNPDVSDTNRVQRFDREAESYMHAATSVLKQEDREKFVFCSSYNKYKFVDYFQRLDEKEAVSIIIEQANKL